MKKAYYIVSALVALASSSANADILNVGVFDFVNLRVGGRSQPPAVPVYVVGTPAPAGVPSTTAALAQAHAPAPVPAAPPSAPTPAPAAPPAPAPAVTPAPAPAAQAVPQQQNWAPAQPVAMVPAQQAPVAYVPVQQLYLPVVPPPGNYNYNGGGYFSGIGNGLGTVVRGVGQTLDAAVPSVNLGIGQRNYAPAPVYYYPGQY